MNGLTVKKTRSTPPIVRLVAKRVAALAIGQQALLNDSIGTSRRRTVLVCRVAIAFVVLIGLQNEGANAKDNIHGADSKSRNGIATKPTVR